VTVSVRLLVYSGLPDPEWTLDDAELEAVSARVRRSLQGLPTDAPPPGLLGYRGFAVQVDPPAANLPALFEVFRGTLTVFDAGEPSTVRDDGGVEPYMLDDARRRGHEGVLRALGVELPPAR
jgi:hypothetical protein